MSKLVWVLCNEDDKWQWTYYVWPRWVPTLDHDEIKWWLYRK